MIALCLAGLIAAQDIATTDARADTGVTRLASYSLSISPDGRWMAYGRTSSGSATTSTLWVRDFVRGTSRQVASNDYGSPNYGPKPVWSPDGSLLAFYGVSNGILQLRVWDRESAREIQNAVMSVGTAAFLSYQTPVWTPDGHFVLSIADTGSPKPLWEEQESDPSLARLRAELVGQRPAPSGVTALATPSLSPSLARLFGATASASRTGAVVNDSRQVVALDVRTGTTQVLARGADFVTLQTADRGRSAIAGIRDSTDALSLYVLPLPGSSPRSPPEVTAAPAEPPMGTPVDGIGAPLRLLAAQIPTGQFQNFSLSPSGHLVAYMPRGSGDVMVVDIATGTLRNATARVPERDKDTASAELQRVAGRFDVPLYGGKFGTGVWDAPVWSADEAALLVVRIFPRRSVTVRQRMELWRVPLTGDDIRRLGRDTTVSLADWAPCQERPLVPCAAGPNGSVLARLRILRPGYSTDSVAYARIDPVSGEVQMLRWTRTASVRSGEFIAARRTADAIALEETVERPPEFWLLRASSGSRGSSTVRALDALNPGLRPVPGIARLLAWKSSSGDSLYALLRLPPGLRDGQRVPVIMEVYPGRAGRGNAARFDGGVSRLDPLRSRGRFALLEPDLPVQFGNGQVCESFARYAVEALDAAIATGRVDSARAGVMGLSYGGYAVNCIVTHTNRFRAAVSEVGPSHITSARALGGRGVTNVTGAWPWEAPERMVKESPVYHLPRVMTPLLLVAGKHDLGNALQAYEMYFGLLALNKPAALLAYDRAGHGDYDRFPEFWPRILSWFATYLGHEDVRR
ncbi:MAG: prolyl oligopeptidase family serine peptidase [Gemmatimonadaceae bacterium]